MAPQLTHSRPSGISKEDTNDDDYLIYLGYDRTKKIVKEEAENALKGVLFRQNKLSIVFQSFIGFIRINSLIMKQ